MGLKSVGLAAVVVGALHVPGQDSLASSGEPGAVSEALADYFSFLVTRPATWVVDAHLEDLYRRDLEDPSAAGDPER